MVGGGTVVFNRAALLLGRSGEDGSTDYISRMEPPRDVQIFSVFLLLVIGGVLSKSISSLELESPCPRDWYYIEAETCAYVIPSAIDTSHLRIFCSQLDSQLQIIDDKPVCIQSASIDPLYWIDDLPTQNLDSRKPLAKRVFGNSGLGR